MKKVCLRKDREEKGRNFIFILKKNIAGSPFYPKGILAEAGRLVDVVGFVRRKMSPKNILVAILGKNGRLGYFPISSFKVHPPEEEIRRCWVRDII